MDTQTILDPQIAAFSAGSADEILQDFADDATPITPDGVLTRRAAIHAAYRTVLSELFKPGTYDFTMDGVHVHGEAAYIAWRAMLRRRCPWAPIPSSCATAKSSRKRPPVLVENPIHAYLADRSSSLITLRVDLRAAFISGATFQAIGAGRTVIDTASLCKATLN